MARLRVGARRHGGRVSYRPKSNYSDRTCLKISFLTSEKGDLPWESPRLERCWIEASVVSLLPFGEQKIIHYRLYPRAHHVERARRLRRDFLPTARPFSSLRAPLSWFIRPRLVHEPAFQTSSDVTTFDASWFGFANQNSTASAELSRFLGERNGRKPRRITAFWPSDVTYDAISVTKPNSGEFLSESGNGIL